MEKQEAISKLLGWCREQIGYKEGANNYNQYAEVDEIESGKLYGWNPQNQPWCDIFVDAGFIECFGYAKACELTYQFSGCTGAACMYSAAYYKQNGAWVTQPEAGDQIFFYAAGTIGHTGIVETVNGSTVTTIEGNTSDQVARRSYTLGASNIAGYGRPKWSVLQETGADESSDNGTATETDYTVKAGDTLWGIALKLLGNGQLYKELMRINGLTSPTIRPGQVIRLTESTEDAKNQNGTVGDTATETTESGTGERTHTVQRNETLWSIALKELGSGFRYKEIKTLNGLQSDLIHPGDVLKLPEK